MEASFRPASRPLQESAHSTRRGGKKVCVPLTGPKMTIRGADLRFSKMTIGHELFPEMTIRGGLCKLRYATVAASFPGRGIYSLPSSERDGWMGHDWFSAHTMYGCPLSPVNARLGLRNGGERWGRLSQHGRTFSHSLVCPRLHMMMIIDGWGLSLFPPPYTLEVIGDTSLRGKTIWLSTALTALQYHARG